MSLRTRRRAFGGLVRPDAERAGSGSARRGFASMLPSRRAGACMGAWLHKNAQGTPARRALGTVRSPLIYIIWYMCIRRAPA